LVDSEFSLLPVHFVVDPGLSWNGIDCFEKEDLDTLLRRYLDIQMIAVPGAETPSVENGGDMPAEAAPPPNVGSWNELAHATSDDSEETGCVSFVILHHERRKDRRTNGAADGEPGSKSSTLSRTKIPISVQTVARSFGSLGRSFRRLRKNITRIARRGTLKRVDRPSAAASALSDHASPNYSPSQNCILCAGLLHRRQPYQEEMVRNYLVSAAERFKRECEKHQATLVDWLNGSTAAAPVGTKTSCVNAGCDGAGDASTAYLCAACFERQQREEIGSSAMPAHVVAPSGSVLRVPVVSSSVCSTERESVHAPGAVGSAPCYSTLSSSAVVLRHRSDAALVDELDELRRSAERLPSLLTKTLTLQAE